MTDQLRPTAQDIADVTTEIDENGSALVRHDIAQAMLASSQFEKWEGDGQATGFVPLRRTKPIP